MAEIADIDGRAALAICESVLLAFNDRNVLTEKVIMGILRDAAQQLENTRFQDARAPAHLSAAKLIRNIISGRNSVRRP